MRAQVGQVINNKYRLLRIIGDGGMGSVYEARHEVLGTSVALKFLHPELSRRQGLVQRFLQEARVSAQIQSPHVVRVTDVDQTPSGAFIVMEYLEGRTLQALYEDLYRAGQQLSYPDALEYAMQMLEGVEAAHKSGIVHRDLKPDNVMITFDGKGRPLIKLLDFGIAKLKVSGEFDRGLTRPGVIMGTPEYMAPEQAYSADTVDARADIFSLGVMIFEMLAGRRPVGGDEPQQIAAAYLGGQVARLTDLAPEIDPALAAAVHHAMAPLVGDRCATVTELRDALEPFAIAAKAPSVMMHSMSSPGVSRPPTTPAPVPVTPPATNVGAEVLALAGSGPVPRTFPPASDVDRHAVHPGVTSPAAPPSMSQPQREPTPLGGFLPAEAGHVPPTKSAAPYVPGQAGPVASDPAATSFAAPLAPLPAAQPRLSVEMSPRPGGTAVGAVGDPYAGTAVAYAPDAGAGTAVGPSAFTPSFASPASLAAPTVPRPRPDAGRRGGALSSLPAILLLAAGVAAAVVGGVYLAQSRAKTDDHEDPPIAPPTVATIKSDPPPVDPPVPTTTTPIPTVRPPLGPRKPPPKGSNGPPGPPAPSSSARPGLIPLLPVVIPSTFPFSFPFGPQERPQQDPPRSQPDLPPRNQREEPRQRPQQRDPGEPPESPRRRPRPAPQSDGFE
jgi:serine/threonine-protein kinase